MIEKETKQNNNCARIVMTYDISGMYPLSTVTFLAILKMLACKLNFLANVKLKFDAISVISESN